MSTLTASIVVSGIVLSLLGHADSFVVQPSEQLLLHPSSLLQSTRSSSDFASKFNATSTPYFVESPIRARNTNENTNAASGVDESETSMLPGLLKLASMHCASQALNTAVKLKIPDLLGTKQLSLEELATMIEANDEDGEEDLPCHRDALFRTLRLLATIDVVVEERAPELQGSTSILDSFRFSLTPLGKSLRTNVDQSSMASCVLHWMEEPLWDSWLELPDYIREGGVQDKDDTLLPFERANGAVSSDEWYNEEEHPESLKQANDFVRLIHNHELQAVVDGLDWSYYKNQRLVDLAGNNGKLAEAIVASEPTLKCSCLDLPSVIGNIPVGKEPKNVELVAGNVLDPDTIPDCEVILMKHFCDRCMWFDDQTIEILRSCKTALQRSGNNSKVRRKIVIADAVLPDCGRIDETNQLPLYLDAMYMLVGRERQRTRSEWKSLAEAAGLSLSGVIDTGVPSCSLIVMEPKPELSP